MAFDPIAYINEPRWQDSRPGLDRIRELLERLGRPQDSLRFVHVAGTNGKGSVCAFLASVLQAAGFRTGLFTSPFIECFEERIRVDGCPISSDDLALATLRVRDAADAMDDHPTEFELMCAVALVHFAHAACDIVVLEVGLGGRLDATNVIEHPEVSVITRIGLDHTAFLGNTPAAVAGEKAGIVKCGVPVVSWPQEPQAMAVIETAAAAHGSELRVPDFSQLAAEPVLLAAGVGAEGAGAGGAVTLTAVSDSTLRAGGEAATAGAAAVEGSEAGSARSAAVTAGGSVPLGGLPGLPVRRFSYRDFCNLETSLLASYQPQNAALALEAALVLREQGWNIPDAAVCAGIAAARWPGRFEVVSRAPLAIVDGGHNPQGARALADTLREVLPGVRPVFVIGVLADKDYPAMLEAVVPLGSAFVVIEPDNPRALPARKLAQAIRWTGQDLLGCSACVRPFEAETVEEGVARALELAGADGVVCAFGSLYAVAALKRAFRKLAG